MYDDETGGGNVDWHLHKFERVLGPSRHDILWSFSGTGGAGDRHRRRTRRFPFRPAYTLISVSAVGGYRGPTFPAYTWTAAPGRRRGNNAYGPACRR